MCTNLSAHLLSNQLGHEEDGHDGEPLAQVVDGGWRSVAEVTGAHADPVVIVAAAALRCRLLEAACAGDFWKTMKPLA